MGEFGETMPGGKAFAELLTIERSAKQISLERKVLPDRAEVRQEHLGAFLIAKATHATLAFTGRLMTVFGPVIQPSDVRDPRWDSKRFAVPASFWPALRLCTRSSKGR